MRSLVDCGICEVCDQVELSKSPAWLQNPPTHPNPPKCQKRTIPSIENIATTQTPGRFHSHQCGRLLIVVYVKCATRRSYQNRPPGCEIHLYPTPPKCQKSPISPSCKHSCHAIPRSIPPAPTRSLVGCGVGEVCDLAMPSKLFAWL